MSLNEQMIAEFDNRWWGTRSISSLLMSPSHELQTLNKVTRERRHLLTRPLYTGSNSIPAFYSNRSRISGWNWVEGRIKEVAFLVVFVLLCFLPHVIKLKPTWILRISTVSTTAMCSERKGSYKLHILFFSNGQSGGEGDFLLIL